MRAPKNTVSAVSGEFEKTIPQHIIESWELASILQDVVNKSSSLILEPITKIDQELNNIIEDKQGVADFKKDFMVICRLVTFLSAAPFEKPLKADLRKLAKSEQKKIKQEMADLVARLESPGSIYVEEVIKHKAKYIKNSLVPHQPLHAIKAMAKHVIAAIDLPEQYEEEFFRDFSSGYVEAKNRRAAAYAIAKAYKRHFDIMPTSTVNSEFMSCLKLLFEHLGDADSEDKYMETLYKDAQKAIRYLKAT